VIKTFPIPLFIAFSVEVAFGPAPYSGFSSFARLRLAFNVFV